jgi:hypothetical protein
LPIFFGGNAVLEATPAKGALSSCNGPPFYRKR